MDMVLPAFGETTDTSRMRVAVAGVTFAKYKHVLPRGPVAPCVFYWHGIGLMPNHRVVQLQAHDP